MTDLFDNSNLNRAISSLKDRGFNFEASIPLYNPIEFFLEKLVQKETAHSKLIADLLNPNGRHGANEIFLKSFLKLISIPEDSHKVIEWGKSECRTEYPISTTLPDSNGQQVNGRIDILIRLKNKSGENLYTLIIENKLNGARLGKNQLQKYKTAIENEDIPPGKIYVILIGSIGKEDAIEANSVLSANQVAEFIEEAFPMNSPTITEVLKSYTTYLRNLSMNEKAQHNAETLIESGLTGEMVQNMKAIKEAYDQLPEAYAIHFFDIMKNELPSEGINIERNESYKNYIDIWRPQDKSGNDMSWRWISIGFYIDSVWFYLVCNRRSDEEVSKYAEIAGFEKNSYTSGWTWHKSKQGLVSISYSEHAENPGTPDFNEIKGHVKKWITEIDKADRKYNSK